MLTGSKKTSEADALGCEVTKREIKRKRAAALMKKRKNEVK